MPLLPAPTTRKAPPTPLSKSALRRATRRALGDGWKDIRVLDAQDLGAWLSMFPGVHARLSAHLNRAVGRTDLARWFDRWSMIAEPPTPAASASIRRVPSR